MLFTVDLEMNEANSNIGGKHLFCNHKDNDFDHVTPDHRIIVGLMSKDPSSSNVLQKTEMLPSPIYSGIPFNNCVENKE